jgi:hypothetical protein
MGSALLYYLAQTWTADRYWQAQHDAPAGPPAAAHPGISRDGPAGQHRAGRPGCHQRTEQPPVNANDATLTELATAQSGSMVGDDAPNAPAGGGFDLIIGVVAGSALGSSGAPYTLTISAIDLTSVSQPWPPQILHQAFDAASGWQLSGTGPDYESTQTIPNTVPGGPGGPLAGHTLQFVASLISQGAQIVTIRQSDPFVLV